MSGKRLIWTDVESFGLNPVDDPLLEVGFAITDLDLNFLDRTSLVIWDQSYDHHLAHLKRNAEKGSKSAAVVLKMHNDSGLWGHAQRDGITPFEAEKQLVQWLNDHEIKAGNEPLCGSSVQFDRRMFEEQMPEVAAQFHYRNIDVSTLKELCIRYNTRIAGRRDEVTQPLKKHRVLPDLNDTVNEFGFYLDNFLHIGVDFLV